MPEPAGMGIGELPLQELPLYVLEEVRPRTRAERVRRPQAPRVTAPEPAPAAAVPHGNWRPGETAAVQYNPSRQADIRFSRLVMVPFDGCREALEGWRDEHGVAGVMNVGRSRLAGPVPPGQSRDRPGAAPQYRLRVELRGGFPNRPIPMDLDVSPRYSYATMIVLLPLHRVVLLRRYFRAGHRFLDAVIDAIESRYSEAGSRLSRQ